MYVSIPRGHHAFLPVERAEKPSALPSIMRRTACMQLSSWKYAAAVHLSNMVDSSYCFPPHTSIDKSPGLSQLVSEHAEPEHLASHVQPNHHIQIAILLSKVRTEVSTPEGSAQQPCSPQ